MDFFQRQQIARRNTRLLEIYFALAVIGTILTLYLSIAVVYEFEKGRITETATVWSLWDPQLFLIVTCMTVLVIACGSFSKMAQMARGGLAVAEMLDGRPVQAHTQNLAEQRLLNVVEEMSIASGTPVPQIYILPLENGINAFAAGHSTNDMVICVTSGALKYLTRDELQGVIGHEFSHILNGDMRLNLRLMGLIFGIMSLTLFGRILTTARDRKGSGLAIFGLVMIVVGAIGVFFSKLIKSAVSRQREFLADAASVQFTRNPAGLASALKKVGSSGSRIDDPNAEDASHFFFANGLTESLFGWMSTHPPLEERIRELDPSWDGNFIPVQIVDPVTQDDQSQTDGSAANQGFAGSLGGIPGAGLLVYGAGMATLAGSDVVPAVGGPSARHLDYASDIMMMLPDSVKEATRTPMSAVALTYVLLLSKDEAKRNTQLQGLQIDPAIYQEIVRLLSLPLPLNSKARLPLLTLSITALRSLSPAQYEQFTQNLQALCRGDGAPDLFAYVLQKIVQRRLDSFFHPAPPPVPQYYALKPLLPDCAMLLSTLACAGQVEPAEIQKAFDLGVRELNVAPGEIVLDTTAPNLKKLDAALDRLNTGTPQIKKTVLGACAACVAADGVIQENEAELLRAISDTLDCPIPPFLSV